MIFFISQPQNARFHDAQVAHILAVRSTSELLTTLAAKLQFPDNFGMNWNALIDCLSDFYWMEERRIVIVHDEMPDIPQGELAHYVGSLLFAMSRYHGRPDAHDEFDVVFPLDAFDEVQRAIDMSRR